MLWLVLLCASCILDGSRVFTIYPEAIVLITCRFASTFTQIDLYRHSSDLQNLCRSPLDHCSWSLHSKKNVVTEARFQWQLKRYLSSVLLALHIRPIDLESLAYFKPTPTAHFRPTVSRDPCNDHGFIARMGQPGMGERHFGHGLLRAVAQWA